MPWSIQTVVKQIEQAYLSIAEAGAYMSLSIQTIRVLINMGKLRKYYPTPRSPRLKKTDIDAYMNKKKARRGNG